MRIHAPPLQKVGKQVNIKSTCYKPVILGLWILACYDNTDILFQNKL